MAINEFCLWCGGTYNLQDHHIIYRSQLGSNEPENLITLCRRHHVAVHARPQFMIEILESLRGSEFWRWDESLARLKGVYDTQDPLH